MSDRAVGEGHAAVAGPGLDADLADSGQVVAGSLGSRFASSARYPSMKACKSSTVLFVFADIADLATNRHRHSCWLDLADELGDSSAVE